MSDILGAERRLAVLIDGDNAQASQIEYILKEVVRYGVATIRRIYGDWTTPQLESWKRTLPMHAIQPIQQFSNTVGKNSTDSAMIIDAMDILYAGTVGGFIIVSSDSDYTKLAIRLREAGMEVIGIGKNHTPKPFVNACNEFRYVENIMKSYEPTVIRRGRGRRRRAPDAEEAGATNARGVSDSNDSNASSDSSDSTDSSDRSDDGTLGDSDSALAGSDDELVAIVTEAHEMVDQESVWVDLRKIANNLKKLDPAFDSRTFGSTKLSKLLQQREDVFEVKRDRARRRIMVRIRDGS
jgi:uncharacterized LabA/DUF88 family protein